MLPHADRPGDPTSSDGTIQWKGNKKATYLGSVGEKDKVGDARVPQDWQSLYPLERRAIVSRNEPRFRMLQKGTATATAGREGARVDTVLSESTLRKRTSGVSVATICKPMIISIRTAT